MTIMRASGDTADVSAQLQRVNLHPVAGIRRVVEVSRMENKLPFSTGALISLDLIVSFHQYFRRKQDHWSRQFASVPDVFCHVLDDN